MSSQKSNWSFYTQILARALNELESACAAPPDSKEFEFYRAEAPMVLDEAREALAALGILLGRLEPPPPSPPTDNTRH